MPGLLKDLWKTSLLHRFWCSVIIMYNIIWPLFLLNLWQAQLVTSVFVLVFVTKVLIHKKYGYKRVLGMANLYWVPMLTFILRNTITIEMSPVEITWIYGMIIVNLMSLILDFKEVKLWFSGDKNSYYGQTKNAQS
ncbi:MAG: hypothetical protein VX642_06135 [Bdellovibrionota bacterium]|nr:hypothetical protein [Bdellovibrionota bacterium]